MWSVNSMSGVVPSAKLNGVGAVVRPSSWKAGSFL